MENVVVILSLCVISAIIAQPARDSLLDKASVHDISANSVSFDKRPEGGEKNGVATVHVIHSSDDQNKGKKDAINTLPGGAAGAAVFSKIIDDIFQIPITVLQSVAKMLGGPLNQGKKAPESSAH